MKISGIISLMFTCLVILSGCKKEDSDNNTSMTSVHYETESHNNGEACMSCHNSGGSGEGSFGVAGSVYTEDLSSANANGTVYLYAGQNGTGTLVATIEVDGKGNFYTTASVIPAAGVYAQVKGSSGNVKNMSQLFTSGNCNSCHGVGTAKIWVN